MPNQEKNLQEEADHGEERSVENGDESNGVDSSADTSDQSIAQDGPDSSVESDEDEQSDEAAARRVQIEALENENSDLKNKYLRKQADFENYRKRMTREREEAVNYANQQLLLDLTSIIDDFERAIRSADESRDYDSFHDGIVLIEKQLTGMLERKWGLRRFDSEGEAFDPQRHEAVMAETRDDHETQMVLEDYQKGYMLRDRVLRSAKVKVSMPGDNEKNNN